MSRTVRTHSVNRLLINTRKQVSRQQTHEEKATHIYLRRDRKASRPPYSALLGTLEKVKHRGYQTKGRTDGEKKSELDNGGCTSSSTKICDKIFIQGSNVKPASRSDFQSHVELWKTGRTYGWIVTS